VHVTQNYIKEKHNEVRRMKFAHLEPSSNLHTTRFNIKKLKNLRVMRGSQNNQQLFPYTTLTNSFL
jgi:hypothetical protein